MKQDQAESLIKLAGFKLLRTWELANMYWGGTNNIAEHYAGRPPTGPWRLLMTEIGPIRIGWRKRVIEIVWEATEVRGIVTTDELTKDDTCVHAYTIAKALEYLTALKKLSLVENVSS